MGQTSSKTHGATIFGYLITPTAPTTQEQVNDPLKSHPDLYGLKSIEGSQSIDNDLAYIDSKYYPDTRLIQPPQEDQSKEAPKLTFATVAAASHEGKLLEVKLSLRSLASLSPEIGLLRMMRKLDLSSNYLESLPDTIGYLVLLEELSLANNKIVEIPDTISYLSRLLELDLSKNQLSHITPSVGYLKKLRILGLSSNQLSRLPEEIGNLRQLTSLDLSHNPICILPAEISQLSFLRRLVLEGCNLQTTLEYKLAHDPPSLKEICARQVVSRKLALKSLADPLANYLASSKVCTSCHEPYFTSYVLRGRFVERSDTMIPLEYRLCSAHWQNQDDRLLYLFSSPPSTTAVSPPANPTRPRLPALEARVPTERQSVRRSFARLRSPPIAMLSQRSKQSV
ncbi:hypothetical protein J3Q64DRAFT_1055069 [Phycomyces blakesleeanus]|uniref:Disease resistance R13L4/SHOC-2-like LRR domain-containing protein n=1 Tax=Phycomyces blakesleeanus TaxID=4837 RepID=A0ABR3BEL8_PHYBL